MSFTWKSESWKGAGKENKKRRWVKITTSMKIEMIVEKTRTGYSAYAEKFPVYTVGKSLEELKSNILEALNLYLDRKEKEVTEEDLRIMLDIQQFFEFYKIINAKDFTDIDELLKRYPNIGDRYNEANQKMVDKS